MRTRLLLLLAILLAVYLWAHREAPNGLEGSKVQTSSAANAKSDREPHAFAPRAAASTLAIDAALPDTSAPLAASEDALRNAAEKGSGEAAWRLQQALAACWQAQMVADDVLTEDGKRRPQREQMEEYLVNADEYCSGTDGDLEDRYWQALELGVGTGDPRSLLAYINAPPVSPALAIRHADRLHRYRQDAPAIAAYLVELGFFDVAGQLALAYDGQSMHSLRRNGELNARNAASSALADHLRVPRRLETPLGQAVSDNPALAWRYARLCEVRSRSTTHCSDIARANAPLLSSQQRQREAEWVERMRKRPAQKALQTHFYPGWSL